MKAVIIGAGPGGLATAINLAGLGYQVEVIEKEAIPGGRMRGLSFDGYQVDTGPSILQLPQILEKIFSRSGKRFEEYVTLQKLEPNTRIHFWDGNFIDTSSKKEVMLSEVSKLDARLQKPLEKWLRVNEKKYAVAYEKFIATNAESLGYYAPWRLFSTLQFKPWQSLYSHLNEYFHDDRLSYALSYPSKYLGLHPTTCSSVFGVIPYIELAFGVWHVKGGFRALAQGMKKCAEDLGATFRMNAPVKRVLVENGRAAGCLLESGEYVHADKVVVNADLPYAASDLFEEKIFADTRLSKNSLQQAKYSCSTFMAYYGLDKTYDNLPHHLIYLSEAARKTDASSLNDEQVDVNDPPFYVCNPHVTDKSGAPNGHSTLYVLVPTPNTSRNVDWKQLKFEMKQRIPKWLEKVGIKNLEPHIQAERFFSAETWRDEFNVFRGAVFNLSHTWLQLGPLRPKVKNREVKDLYWVGGGTHPGSGLLTIFESANIAADYLARDAGKSGLPEWPYVPRAP